MQITCYNRDVTSQEAKLPLYAVTVGECSPQEDVYRPFGMEDYQLLYTAQGVGRVRIGEETWLVEPGTVLILPPFTPHEYRADGAPWHTLWLTYSGVMARGCFPFRAGIWSCRSFPRYHGGILRVAQRSGWRRRSSATLYALLLEISESEISKREGLSPEDNGLAAAIRYISSHYAEPLELEKLCAIAGCSQGHFCRIFRAYTHMRPMEYVTRLRIEAAKELLLNEPLATAAEISRRVGYQSASYFTRVFCAAVGKTPDRFRR